MVRDFAQDGVVYLELRTTPRVMPAAALDKAGYVDAVLQAIEAATQELEQERAQLSASHGQKPTTTTIIRTRLILSVDRRNTPEEAAEVVALARRFRDAGRGVVGVDLCGDPTRGDVAAFTPAFVAARAAGLGLTVHFAEAEASATAAELSTILSWRPDRLGHVIHVPADVRRRIAEQGAEGGDGGGGKKIGLELCLSCNVHARMIKGGFEAHHFGEWWRVDGTVVVPWVSLPPASRPPIIPSVRKKSKKKKKTTPNRNQTKPNQTNNNPPGARLFPAPPPFSHQSDRRRGRLRQPAIQRVAPDPGALPALAGGDPGARAPGHRGRVRRRGGQGLVVGGHVVNERPALGSRDRGEVVPRLRYGLRREEEEKEED